MKGQFWFGFGGFSVNFFFIYLKKKKDLWILQHSDKHIKVAYQNAFHKLSDKNQSICGRNTTHAKNVLDRNWKVLPDINITSTPKGYLNISRVLITQGVSSQIRIVRKFNIISKMCSKQIIFMKLIIIAIKFCIFYYIIELWSN